MSPIQPVYLWRKGNPVEWALAFLDCFFRYDPGDDVRLLIILKGFDKTERPRVFKLLKPTVVDRLDLFHTTDEGLDLTAYRKVCAADPQKNYLFFNSHSRIIAPNWFECYEKAWAEIGSDGLIGASGSYEAPDFSGKQFPNPHIRTNAFLISGKDYLEAAHFSLATKADCHRLEAGADSMTNFFVAQNKPALVMDADGKLFASDDWPKSATFRLEHQQKLIVHDNRSAKYHHGVSRRRLLHAKASWGNDVRPPKLGLGQTVVRYFWAIWFYHGYRLPYFARSIMR